MSKTVHEIHGTAEFDYSDGPAAVESITRAILNVMLRAESVGADLAWSTLAISFDVAAIEEQRLTEKHPRIIPGRSTVHATAQGLIAHTETNGK